MPPARSASWSATSQARPHPSWRNTPSRFCSASPADWWRTSHAVSLHVKLTDATRGLIGRRELSLMKPGALLVNTARGAVVDNAALAEALNAGCLGGAGIDVFEVEPVPADHPLLGCAQVVLTPHVADQNPEGMEILNRGAVDNVLAFLEGKPINRVV